MDVAPSHPIGSTFGADTVLHLFEFADGLLDLVCRFRLADAGFHVGDTLGLVTGALDDGRPFMSADRVRII